MILTLRLQRWGVVVMNLALDNVDSSLRGLTEFGDAQRRFGQLSFPFSFARLCARLVFRFISRDSGFYPVHLSLQSSSN